MKPLVLTWNKKPKSLLNVMSSLRNFLPGSPDPGDTYDPVKWDFNETVGMDRVVGRDGYVYLICPTTNGDQRRNSLYKLEQVRAKVSNIANYLHNNIDKYPPNTRDGIRLFIGIHGEMPIDNIREISDEQYSYIGKHYLHNGTASNIVYSQMPPNTPFRGLNKPKERYINPKAPKIGKDENLRSKYRHIFLKLENNNYPLEKDKNLKNLVIHEIAHTAANHQRWRNDDHGQDFKLYQDILTKAWDMVLENP